MDSLYVSSGNLHEEKRLKKTKLARQGHVNLRAESRH